MAWAQASLLYYLQRWMISEGSHQFHPISLISAVIGCKNQTSGQHRSFSTRHTVHIEQWLPDLGKLSSTKDADQLSCIFWRCARGQLVNRVLAGEWDCVVIMKRFNRLWKGSIVYAWLFWWTLVAGLSSHESWQEFYMEILTPAYIRDRRKELRANHGLSDRDPRISWINSSVAKKHSILEPYLSQTLSDQSAWFLMPILVNAFINYTAQACKFSFVDITSGQVGEHEARSFSGENILHQT